MTQPWVNLTDYSVFELIIFGTGCAFWVVVYAMYAKNIYHHRMIGMPVFAAASNFGWEFVWSFATPYTDMGQLFLWGYRSWLLFDLYIFYGVLRYGHRQISTKELRSWFRPVLIIVTVLWGFAYYFMKKQGYDTPIGANSAYIAQLLISALYLILLLRHRKYVWASKLVTWGRILGTGLITVFMFIHYPDNLFLLMLAGTSTLLDVIYLLVFYERIRVEHAVITEE